MLHKLPGPIERHSAAWSEASPLLQGNILNGFPGAHTRLIPFRLRAHQGDGNTAASHYDVLRHNLGSFAASRVTSAAEQDARYEAARPFRESGAPIEGPAPIFGNLFLSVTGYLALGYSTDELLDAFPHPQGDREFQNWFLEGMAHQGKWLGDPTTLLWETAYQHGVDGMLLLNCEDEQLLNASEADAIQQIHDGLGEPLTVESGTRLTRPAVGAEKPPPIEHFGFADGISQPRFFVDDLTSHRHDMDDPEIVLYEDGLASGQDKAFGSFLVYRKLEQDVAGFRAAERALASHLGLPAADAERAGAMIVGRFRDGTPLTEYSSGRGSTENGFNFTDDSNGSKCPLQAHIRKVRPRTESANFRRRIVRRGVPYGPYDPDGGQQVPATGRGLHFLAFMRNIHSQFAAVQRDWANRSDFPRDGTGPDPVIGQGAARTEHPWPVRWGESETRALRIEHYVTLRGGEFFFAPSVAFFDSLAPSGSGPSGSVRAAAQSARKKTATRSKKAPVVRQRSKERAAKSR